MEIPSHYRPVYRTYIRFSLVMMVLALLLGIAFQESAKKTPISEALPAGMHLEATINLALVHGHAFLIGVLVPLAITWISYLGLSLGFAPLSEKSWNWATRLYLPGSAMAVVLMLYKGYALLLGVRNAHGAEIDLAAISQSMFMGSHALRASVYGLTHTAMAVGVFIFVVSFWKTMNKANQ
jgi:hypothetical protein